MRAIGPVPLWALLAAGLLVSPAGASDTRPMNHVWTVRDVGNGCKAVIHDAEYMDAANGRNDDGSVTTSILWQGGCNANGLIDGPGVMVADFDQGKERTIDKGTAVNGLLEGPLRSIDLERSSGPSGYDMKVDDEGPLMFDLTMVHGCSADDDGTDGYLCVPAEGLQARDRYLASRNSAAGLSGSSGAPGLGPSSSGGSAGQAGGNGDVFGRCISVVSLGKGGTEDLWALRNSCTSKVTVSYCFRADFEAEGDPNLCRHSEKRTHEIAAGGQLDFAYTLITEGSALSDGRIAGPNSLRVSGYACTARAPDTYFSGGQFKSNGC